MTTWRIGFAHGKAEVDQGSRTRLHDIHDYIAADNRAAAQKVIAGIFQKAQMLREFPVLGQKYRDEAEGEIRILLYGHYRIVYLIKTDGYLDILGVFHGALDIERYFP